jgi:hypothetical protein
LYDYYTHTHTIGRRFYIKGTENGSESQDPEPLTREEIEDIIRDKGGEVRNFVYQEDILLGDQWVPSFVDSTNPDRKLHSSQMFPGKLTFDGKARLVEQINGPRYRQPEPKTFSERFLEAIKKIW